MKARIATTIFLAAFSLSASAFPHASWTQKTDPNCTQAGGDSGFRDLIQQVNLFTRYNPATKTQDPRGLLSVMAASLNITKHADHLREVTGDLFCPGISTSSQGTATYISEDGTLLTNAHLFIDTKGKDKEALSSCFWQRKGSKEKLALDISTLRPLTRDMIGEGHKDLSIVKLKKPLRGVRPVRIDDSGVPLKNGDQIIMVSATQEGVPGVQYTTEKIVSAGMVADFVYSSDLIAQSCTKLAGDIGIWGDCSAIKGASGSGVYVLRGDDIVLVGIHKAGGLPPADHKPFNRNEDAPGGGSYSYAVQLNRDITDEIQTLQAQNDRSRTSSDQRASLESR